MLPETVSTTLDAGNWYCIYTRFKHESKITRHLTDRGFQTYLPVKRETRQWKDRKKCVELPLFPCYLFVKCQLDKQSYFQIVDSEGVVRVLGHGWPKFSTVPEHQIDAIRRLLSEKKRLTVIDGFMPGELVRVRNGVFAGIEGVVRRKDARNTFLVIAVDSLNKSLEIRLDSDGLEIERVKPAR